MIPQLETKQLRTFFITIIGGILLYRIYLLWFTTFLLLPHLFIIALWIIFLLVVFVNFKYDRVEYEKQKTKFSFLSSIVGSLICLTGIIIHLHMFLLFNSPNLIEAKYHDGDLTGITYSFKTNGVVILEIGTGFGSDYKYGEYTIEDSLIEVKIDGEFTSDKLKIAKDKLIFEPHNSKEVMANQITTKGRGIKRNVQLKITEDNR